MSWQNMIIYRLRDEKLVTLESVYGWTDMLVQCGAIPLPPVDRATMG